MLEETKKELARAIGQNDLVKAVNILSEMHKNGEIQKVNKHYLNQLMSKLTKLYFVDSKRDRELAIIFAAKL